MDKEKLTAIFDSHNKWLNDEDGKCADLRNASLINADLRGVNLRGANLRSANLSAANLSGANLSDANLRGDNLIYANLSSANLRGANLRSADLSGANLFNANLLNANLRGANLSGANLRSANLSAANLSSANLLNANLSAADLRGANLIGADLRSANLSAANLSSAKGIKTASEFFAKLETDEFGYIVYKKIGDTDYDAPKHWTITPGSFLTEVVNPIPTLDCACGVNFGTREWCDKNYKGAALWRCRIRFEDLADVVIPYNSDGKGRCARLELIEKL